MNKARARTLRKNPTEAERALWQRIRLRQLDGHKFRRQQPLSCYIVDFVCLEKKLIVELDGGHHTEQVASDTERTVWLEQQGFRVLRFWDNDVLKNIEAVTETIRATLSEACPPTPALPPMGEGGL